MLAKPVQAAGGGGAAPDYILIRDERASGTQGGGALAGVWQTRVLNTEVNDDGGHASLSSNQITLAAGTYRVRAHAPAYTVNTHKIKLYNITDTVDIIIGTSQVAIASNLVENRSFLEGQFIIAGTKTIELQHRCQTARGSDGLGKASSYGVIEVYAIIELWKEA
jgi:hypothetical protein